MSGKFEVALDFNNSSKEIYFVSHEISTQEKSGQKCSIKKNR